MFKVLFLLFIVIPIAEIALLLQVSEVIGGFATLALVILTAVFGARLVKQQGLGAYANVQQQMARGQLPASDLFAGICVIIAGVLLMTPGIMTDVLGFMLLTPAIRQKLAKALLQRATVQVQSGGMFTQHTSQQQEQQFDPFAGRPSGHGQSQRDEGNTTLEGEFKRKD
ncbi:F exclusion suppressor [Pseudoalteromonas rubra]|uniref:F exclusion suppressor n=1 Tax=Pseudoalteromonas rubra TaxID=43658 RepID=A0A5S3WT14_9GAMM|nr:FxsA family protein [Pseudoalteromonas rubra]TMP31572.1 F exclusion suppressor [Pseudoalteromonas rubra]TMP34655.1 F exclusion suppressor [Pseudoalteromonas rubra]